MELILAGFLAFIISGLDDFTMLVMLFIIANNNIFKNILIITGTLLALLIVIIISYFIGDTVKDYIWILSILLIIYSIKNIINNIFDSNRKNNKIDISRNLFTTSVSIFLINAGDDFSIYSTVFASIENKYSNIYFSLGILIGGIVTIMIANNIANIISNIESIEKKFESVLIHNIPYIIMLILGCLILYKNIG